MNISEGFIKRPGAGALFDERAIEGRCAGDGSGVELRTGAVEGERGGGARANIQNAVDDAAGVEGDGHEIEQQHRRKERGRGALMLLAAAVALGDVLIWTL